MLVAYGEGVDDKNDAEPNVWLSLSETISIRCSERHSSTIASYFRFYIFVRYFIFRLPSQKVGILVKLKQA